MIAVDTNILVYAHVAVSPWNARAYAAISDLAASGTPWAIPWHCVHEFYAIASHPKIYRSASRHETVIDQLDKWFESPTLTLISDGVSTWPILRGLAMAGRLAGPAIYDARIAATCIEHGVSELWSADRDFSRYPSLRVRNPLVDPLPTRAGEQRRAYQLGRRTPAAARRAP